jgi:hypothetical protein
MSLNAQASHGTLLQVGDGGSPEVFTTIAGVGDWDPPGYMSDALDTTAQDDTGQTFIVSNLIKNAEFTVKLFWETTNPTHNATTGLIAAARTRPGVRKNYRSLYPDGSGQLFNSLVTGFQPHAPNNGILSADVKFQPTGPITPF